jgi:hypothetical protein
MFANVWVKYLKQGANPHSGAAMIDPLEARRLKLLGVVRAATAEEVIAARREQEATKRSEGSAADEVRDIVEQEIEKVMDNHKQRLAKYKNTHGPTGVPIKWDPIYHARMRQIQGVSESAARVAKQEMMKAAPNVAADASHPEAAALLTYGIEAARQAIAATKRETEQPWDWNCDCSALKCGPPHHDWCSAMQEQAIVNPKYRKGWR